MKKIFLLPKKSQKAEKQSLSGFPVENNVTVLLYNRLEGRIRKCLEHFSLLKRSKIERNLFSVDNGILNIVKVFGPEG